MTMASGLSGELVLSLSGTSGFHLLVCSLHDAICIDGGILNDVDMMPDCTAQR